MRIGALCLYAYGHFLDRRLDFGRDPGLHLIYGDNEAGKSTILRALSSVLFGYPHEVVDGFRHDTKDISIGIDLVAEDGRELSFVRKRRGKNLLVNGDGVPIEEGQISAFLGGISREMFEKVFALDHLRLHRHAQALLAEGGALGFSLAEAGSGIVALKTVLDGLRSDRSALFLPGGSRPKLNQLIARLTELRREVRRCSVSPIEYKKRQKQIDEIDEALRLAREEKKTAEIRLRQLERIGKNLPMRAEYRAFSLRIQELSDVPILPADMTERRISAQADLKTAEEEQISASAKIEELEAGIKAIVIDERILEAQPEIERLSGQRSVIEKAESDLPKREAEREQHYRAARNLLSEAELSGDPERLSGILPSALKRKSISTLADAGRKLLAQQDTVRENLEKATAELEKARLQKDGSPPPHDMEEISRAVVFRDKLGDIGGEIFRKTRSLERKANILSETIRGLGVSSGSASDLRELRLPSVEAVGRYRERFLEIDGEIGSLLSETDRLDDGIKECDRKIAALKFSGDVATEEDLKAVRLARDEGWSLVRGIYIDRQDGVDARETAFAPDAQIVSSYEKQVERADHIADLIRSHVEEATELSLLENLRCDLDRESRETGEKLEILKSARKESMEEWSGLWPQCIGGPELPGEMLDWLKRRETALAEDLQLEEERGELDLLVKKERDAKGMLAGALKELMVITPEEDLDRLREKAGLLLEESVRSKSLYDRANEAVRAQREHREQAEQAALSLENRIAEWRQEWGVALGGIGLGSDLGIDAVLVTLEAMSGLNVLKNQIEDLTHRIDTMREDRERFRRDVNALSFLIPGFSSSDPLELLKQLRTKLEAARTGMTRSNGLQEQLKDLSGKREQASAKILASKGVLSRLSEQAGCSDFLELSGIEEKSAEKQRALNSRQMLETHLLRDGSGLDLDTLFMECDEVEGDRVPGEIALQRSSLEETGTRIEQLVSDRATLTLEFDLLLSQNQAADFLQEAAIVEAEIAELVQDYSDLAIQETFLRQAIELYRDRNQGPVLFRARKLFSELTGGAYSGLRADMGEKDEPILIAEHPSRGSLEVSALSDGTVDPLYLALRLAVVQEHNATCEPIPFVADDLFLNMDNHRAKAALRTLSTVAEANQVLFFTHNAHMVDLARSSVPGNVLREHRL